MNPTDIDLLQIAKTSSALMGDVIKACGDGDFSMESPETMNKIGEYATMFYGDVRPNRPRSWSEVRRKTKKQLLLMIKWIEEAEGRSR